MIIDTHTHLFPPEIVANYQSYRASDPWFHDAFAAPRILFSSADEMLAEMNTAEVDQAIVVGWPWRDPGICNEHNAYLADISRNSGGRLHWMAITNPTSRSAVNHVIDAKANGAVAIGELNADGQGFDWRDQAKLQAFVEACVRHDLPAMIHTSEPTGHLYAGKGTATPDKIVEFAGAFPELRIVAAHWGGGLPFYELMPEVQQTLQNVAYDTAASTYLYRFEVFEVVMRIVGAQRVLFGTDYPVLTMKRFVDRVNELSMEPSEREALFATNARRVYRLPGGVES